jgi:hypothetical protein
MKGHIRERNGAFEIRYSWQESGHRRTATAAVHGTRKDAERELRKRLTALDEGRHVDGSRITVGEWLDTWHKGIEAQALKTWERCGEYTVIRSVH